ncbi:MAG: hypothetical protein R3E61_08610 [Pseudomonadales bacterium]
MSKQSCTIKLRVIHLATNQGKAMGLNTAALMTDSEYLIVY